jgi:pimeloyl-ACP methyl ester carboxylesterase
LIGSVEFIFYSRFSKIVSMARVVSEKTELKHGGFIEKIISEAGMPPVASKGRVLFAHGVLASLSELHNIKILHRLANAGYEVFAVELPGHGESAQEENFEYDRAVQKYEDAIRFMAKNGDFQFLVHSGGGPVSIDALNNISRAGDGKKILRECEVLFHVRGSG